MPNTPLLLGFGTGSTQATGGVPQKRCEFEFLKMYNRKINKASSVIEQILRTVVVCVIQVIAILQHYRRTLLNIQLYFLLVTYQAKV